MATFLHLLKRDSPPVALPVIAANRGEAGARTVVVVLDGGVPPWLSPDIPVRHLAEGDLDYAALLELIFESDHVITW